MVVNNATYSVVVASGSLSFQTAGSVSVILVTRKRLHRFTRQL